MPSSTKSTRKNVVAQKSRDKISNALKELKAKIPYIEKKEHRLMSHHKTLLLATKYIIHLLQQRENPDILRGDFRRTVEACLTSKNVYTTVIKKAKNPKTRSK